MMEKQIFITNVLLLNSVPFLEKPPFYFWIVGASIKLFGKFNEFAVRFPIALMATFLIFYTYFFGRKVLSRKFGLISAIVLLTSVFFLIIPKVVNEIPQKQSIKCLKSSQQKASKIVNKMPQK